MFIESKTHRGGPETGESIVGIIPSIRKSTVAPPKPKREKTVSNRNLGIIKMFNVEKDYGFIRTKGAEYFFHTNNVEESDKSGVVYFMPGEKVTFEVGTDNRGRPAAVNVRMGVR